MQPVSNIVEAVFALSCQLPGQTISALAEAILITPEATLRAEVSRRVPHHHHRNEALAFIDHWKKHAPDIDAKTVSVALQTAALSERSHRDSQTVELAWTGPATEAIPFRRTEQAILQVLDSAKQKITLVSFAVYRIPNISNALVRAAKRGVKINVIVETPNKIEGEGEYSTIQALGQEVADCSKVYYWPRENRPVGENNRVGILHVKCVVADGNWLFLSSANLTKQAFTINMELGMLVRGGSVPQRVEKQFNLLIQTRTLIQV